MRRTIFDDVPRLLRLRRSSQCFATSAVTWERDALPRDDSGFTSLTEAFGDDVFLGMTDFLWLYIAMWVGQ